jgi:phosphoglycerol transferase MdoB-like AlkP superfamily enzyme
MHALFYATLMAILLFTDFATGDAWRGAFSVQWPAIIWGALLLIHGIIATRGTALFGREWEERKVEELMRRNGRPG